MQHKFERSKLQELLNTPTDYYEFPGIPIRQILKDLLDKILEEEDCFSGKRPFGNSGFYYVFELAVGQVFPDIVKYTKQDDDDDDCEVINHEKYKALLRALTAELTRE